MNEDGEIPADMGWEGFEGVRSGWEIYIDKYGLAHVGNSRTAACHHVFHVEVEFAGFIFKKREKREGMQEIVKHLPRHANDVMESDCKRTDLAIPSAVSCI